MDVFAGIPGSCRKSRLFEGVVALLFLFLLIPPGAAPAIARSPSFTPGGARPLDLPAFQAELRRIQRALEENPQPDRLSALANGLPAEWSVKTAERDYEIPTDPLPFLLRDAANDSSQRSARLARAQEWLGELASEAAAYAAPGVRPGVDARAALGRILSAPEFNAVYQQSAWDRLRQRILTWIWQKISGLFARMANHPTAGRALVWLILLAAVTGVALLLFRAWTRRASFEELKVAETFAVVQSWQEWIHMAQSAAAGGAYRDAVHSLYWAAVVHLEDLRAIPRERTRTPRERLRQFAPPEDSGAGDASQRRDALRGLTSGLEKIWYAGIPATQQDFAEAARFVHELGCRWP